MELNWLNIDLNATTDSILLLTDGPVTNISMEEFLGTNRWALDNGVELLFDVVLNTTEGRQITHFKHNFANHRRIDIETGCYNYYFTLVVDGCISSSDCMRT